jgi:dsDNA-specific endonuclease/ATPase MutS2
MISGCAVRGRLAAERAMTDPDCGDPIDPASPFPEPVEIPIEESIDLHLFRASEIGDVVAGYLDAAIEKGFREVRLIHGRGRGVQRNRVQSLLARHPAVERFADAPGDRGGWGATIAWLRSPDEAKTS